MRPLLLSLLVLAGASGCEGFAGDVEQKAPPAAGAGGGAAAPAPSPTSPQPGVTPGPSVIPLPDQVTIERFECTPASGITPLGVSCVLRAVHSNGKALGCTVNPGDGAAELTTEDCATERTVTFTLNKVGTFKAVATVKDPGGVTATREASLEVLAPPNVPPTIDSFTAAPAQGGAPLNTTLSFAAKDADGDSLSCAIDVGADGTDDYQLDCAKGSQAHTVGVPGTVTVKLTVKDGRGGQATATLSLTAKQAVGDVRISKVEWGQSVIAETPRLVAGKAALLRVYVLGDKAGIGGVTAEVEGLDAQGVSLGKLPLTGPATAPTAEAPADLTQQYKATVPATWVAPGVELRVAVDPQDALPETDEANNLRSLKPLVGKGNVMELTPVPVVHQGQTAATPNAEPFLTRIWPLKGVTSTPRAPYTFSGTLSGNDQNAWGNLLQSIAAVRQSDGSKRNYYGWVKVNYGSGIAGIGYVGQEAATGRDDSMDTITHELGHNMGRNHAPCGGVAGADQNYPYAGAKIGSWGYDSASGKLVNPNSNFDLMSYCDPAWVSDYNYKAVQTFLEAQASVTGAAAPYETALLIAGSLGPAGVELRAVQALRGAASSPQEGELTARLLFASGRQRDVSLATTEVSDTEQRHFLAVVPADEPLAALQLRRGERVLVEHAAAAQVEVPTLERLDATHVRVRWNARAAPFAQLAHFDAQGQRTTLALWLEGGDAVVPLGDLKGGHFEVSASDGVATARAEVDLAR